MEPLIAIVGETASGKSALALALARQFDGEIICADSWTVYKGFDIGTSKPTPADQREIPHHLLDIKTANQGFSAAQFKRLAAKTIQGISVRGKLPILVGGSGLYVDSIIYDYSFLPAGPVGKRARLNAMPISELLKIIEKEGFNSAGVDKRNKRRLIRLIESGGQMPTKNRLRQNTLILGLNIPKTELEARITERTNQMLSDGLESEVKAMRKNYDWSVEPMKGIGYREWQDYFEGQKNIEQVRSEIIRDSLKLAKKQRTWFKRNNSIQWVKNQAEAVDFVTTLLNK